MSKHKVCFITTVLRRKCKSAEQPDNLHPELSVSRDGRGCTPHGSGRLLESVLRDVNAAENAGHTENVESAEAPSRLHNRVTLRGPTPLPLSPFPISQPPFCFLSFDIFTAEFAFHSSFNPSGCSLHRPSFPPPSPSLHLNSLATRANPSWRQSSSD